MKHRILVAVACLLLAALILLLLPSPDPTPTPGITTPTTSILPTIPTTPTTTEPIPLGVVRLYSCDASIREALTGLAQVYTQQTGLEVIVLGPEAEDCQATLQGLMAGEDAPSIFCVHSGDQLSAWEDILLDLDSTFLAPMLRSESLKLGIGSKWLAIPMGLKAHGLLMNAELMAGVALTRSDISDFASLGTAVQILKNNSVKAFPTLAPTPEDAWYLLSVKDADRTRAFLDMYLTSYNKTGDGLTQFLDGKAAFLPGGSWDYDLLASYEGRTLHVRNLDILPTYLGGAMQYLCDWAWCVNSTVSREDLSATMAFLTWLVTPDEVVGSPMEQLQVLTPFASCHYYGNQLEKKLLTYMALEPAVIVFDEASPENELLPEYLTTYLASPTDENWEQLWLCIELIGTPPLTE
jgi:raffinose/stachyose/melibiose transport system substrate-binding protein